MGDSGLGTGLAAEGGMGYFGRVCKGMYGRRLPLGPGAQNSTIIIIILIMVIHVHAPALRLTLGLS